MDVEKNRQNNCDEGYWRNRNYKFSTYGEILYPEKMSLMSIKSVLKLFQNDSMRVIAFVGASACDKKLSKKRNDNVYNEYGTNFFSRKSKNICRMKHSDYGCDTMDVILADINGNLDDQWKILNIAENLKKARLHYSVSTITRKNGEWIILK